MSHLLLTNDDGIDSPALVPLARALASVGPVEVVVPDRERSWVSKAVTRHEDVQTSVRQRDGMNVWTTTGYPADAVQIGVHGLFDAPPKMVVSGINIGFNFGAAYLLSSGTVGAASEAWISGVPALAVSTGTTGDWPSWVARVRSPAAVGMWERLADVTVEIVTAVLDQGFPSDIDVINVNLPDHADTTTPRLLTEVARVGYDRLFARAGPNTFVHEFGGDFRQFGDLAGTDIEAVRSGRISITALRLHHALAVPESLSAALGLPGSRPGKGDVRDTGPGRREA